MDMNNGTKTAYAEVMQVLKYFDRNQVMKIPIEIIEYFKENQNENYISKIDKEDIFNKNNISREALEILAYLNLTYWADEEQKKELIKMYRKNDYLNAGNNYTFTIEDKRAKVETDKNADAPKDVQMIKYKESKLGKIINKIKSFFRRVK